jgi:hypothetical protein
MSLKNSNDTNGNRIRDLPVCSVVLNHYATAHPECRSTISYIVNVNILSISVFLLNLFAERSLFSMSLTLGKKINVSSLYFLFDFNSLVQLEFTPQHNKSRSAAARPPRPLRYRPAAFFRHLRLFTFSLPPERPTKTLHPNLFRFVKLRKSESALA